MKLIILVGILSAGIAFAGVKRKPNSEDTKPSPVRASAAKVKKTAKATKPEADVKAKE